MTWSAGAAATAKTRDVEARQSVAARHAVSLDQARHEDDETSSAGADDAILLDDLMRVLPRHD